MRARKGLLCIACTTHHAPHTTHHTHHTPPTTYYTVTNIPHALHTKQPSALPRYKATLAFQRIWCLIPVCAAILPYEVCKSRLSHHLRRFVGWKLSGQSDVKRQMVFSPHNDLFCSREHPALRSPYGVLHHASPRLALALSSPRTRAQLKVLRQRHAEDYRPLLPKLEIQ